MNLSNVKNVFTPLLPGAVFHFEAHNKQNRYIVWAEDAQAGGSYADDVMQEQVIEGTVDLYTKTDFDPLFKKIQIAMNRSGMNWRLNSTQYEEKTKYIHHEWVWQISDEVGES
jgi:hypothetical protein